MKNNKENLFVEKFHLLNAQKYSEEIDLATSSSSDYETVTHNSSVDEKKSRTKKRKRKNKYSKNISSLDITINDVGKYSKRNESGRKSPLLCSKDRLSPTHNQSIVQQSPILGTKNLQRKSPILSPKILPKSSFKVKKKLFNDNHKLKDVSNVDKVYVSKTFDTNIIKSFDEHKDNYSRKSKLDNEFYTCDKSENTGQNSVCKKIQNRNNTKTDLIKKVKLFFESHFSSEEASQNIISDSQASSKSEELDIYTCKSEGSTSSCVKGKQSSSPENCYEHEETKNIRYKKNGLAYRLNNLLKKRKAHISLWQHERYLAGNSNFIIPKQEHVVFCIEKFHFKYGCYMLEVFDINGQFHCVVINCYYVNETIKSESVLKLYKPYQYVDLNDKCKLIINVCKFQIVDLDL